MATFEATIRTTSEVNPYGPRVSFVTIDAVSQNLKTEELKNPNLYD
jgi:hypothetical protein